MNVQDNKSINDRLKRCAGQLNKVALEIQNCGECSDIIPQLLAVRGALNAATVSYLEQAMAECTETTSAADMVEVFKQLIKHS